MHGNTIIILKYNDWLFHSMASSEKTNITRRRRGEESRPLAPIMRHMNDIFEDFRTDVEKHISSCIALLNDGLAISSAC